MQRTQVYLTTEERAALSALAKVSGKTQSQLLREAVDEYLDKRSHVDRKAILQQAKGLWANRDDLPNFKKIRKELDREDND